MKRKNLQSVSILDLSDKDARNLEGGHRVNGKLVV